MKRRITYISASDAPFDPAKQAILSNDALSIRNLDAAKEERITLGFEELSADVLQALKATHELHIRWATERYYDSVTPYLSRVTPGLHVFYTRLHAGTEEERSDGRLCMLLKEIFDEELKCTSPEASFTVPPVLSDRFASTSSLQYYSLLPSLSNLVTFIQRTICQSSDKECLNHASSLLSAESVDMDYDSISHALTISTFWSQPPERNGWVEEIRRHKGARSERVEVGLLANERALDPEDLSLGGFLAVVGEDSKLKQTLFSFPSRHHPLSDNATYTTAFETPTGLHPTLKISMPPSALTRPDAPADAVCALHTYLTLPSTIFADKYQLSTTDSLFLDSHNLVALRAVSGETDLEAPDWVVPRWGSNLLLEVATPPEDKDESRPWNVTIPLHLRYLRPSKSGHRQTSLPWPVVFWACTAEDGTKMGVNPFDRVNLGWEGLFGPRTMFFQLHPGGARLQSSRIVEDISVPVLQATEEGSRYSHTSEQVQLGTVVAIVLGFLWILWKLGLLVRSTGFGEQREVRSSTATTNKKKN